jgi:hypothetical protein
LCPCIEAQATMTARLCYVEGQRSRVEGEHREEFEVSIMSLDERTSLLMQSRATSYVRRTTA